MATTTIDGLGTFYVGRPVDPDSGDTDETPVLYDSQDLTTHAFIVGMTGSGKTGLGIDLIEEAAIDKVPVIAVDPKGDLGNLLLTFPDLKPGDFQPWMDPQKAAQEGVSTEELAKQTAELWSNGLADWDQGPDRIRALKDSATFRIYTPGSSAGLPISVLGALTPPEETEGEAFTEQIEGVVSSLLSLLDVEADPLQSPEHVFLSKVVANAWSNGKTLTLTGLIDALEDPPFDTVGAMEVDTFFSTNKRNALARKLNSLLAAPGFESWKQGIPLKAEKLLYTDEGMPRVSVLSIAHLSDAERMFFLTRLLGELVGWMRRQSGTGSLRAILYIDEIFGYLPPTANPPSKTLLLTLLKQARAFGIGVVLSTQNSVDIDYKALSNCGTWFVGRLQTERDKERLLDGLEGASQNPAFDRNSMDDLISGLGKRTFLFHNVHEAEPVVMRTRWAMSYLAGPMTRDQISTVMEKWKQVEPPAAPAPETKPRSHLSDEPTTESAFRTTEEPPVTPKGLHRVFLASGDEPTERYVPRLLCRMDVSYVSKTHDVEYKQPLNVMVDVAYEPDWENAEVLKSVTEVEKPDAGTVFEALPPGLEEPSLKPWDDVLRRWVQKNQPLTLFTSSTFGVTSEPGESEADFRNRLTLVAREKRDAKKEKLRKEFLERIEELEDEERKALSRIERESAQYGQKKFETIARLGSSLLNAFLGKGISRTTIRKFGTAARTASHVGKEKSDLAQAQKEYDELVKERTAKEEAIENDFQDKAKELNLDFSPEKEELEETEISPVQKDMSVDKWQLAWVPSSNTGKDMSLWGHISKLKEQINAKETEIRHLVEQTFLVQPCSSCFEYTMELREVSPNARSVDYECLHCGNSMREAAGSPKSSDILKPWHDFIELAEKYNKIVGEKHQIPRAIQFTTPPSPLPYEQTSREPIPEAVRSEVWRRDKGQCVKCGSKENLQFDHIIPVSKGGATTVRNLQLLCKQHNLEKGAQI